MFSVPEPAWPQDTKKKDKVSPWKKLKLNEGEGWHEPAIAVWDDQFWWKQSQQTLRNEGMIKSMGGILEDCLEEETCEWEEDKPKEQGL